MIRPCWSLGLVFLLGLAALGRSSAARLGAAVSGASDGGEVLEGWGDEDGWRAAKRLRRGINFGNAWEAPPGTWGDRRYRAEDFRAARAAGFDHVRLPVAWHHYQGGAPEYLISPSVFGEMDALVGLARAQGLAVILDWHHFDRLTETLAPDAVAQWHAGWAQIARHYRDVPARALVFELLNEPRDAATTERMGELYPAAIRALRAEDPRRTILVSPGGGGGLYEVPKLRLPRELANVVVTGHCYAPFLFTHQGASWTGRITLTTGLRFPGPPPSPLIAAPGAPAWVAGWIRDYDTLPAETNPGGPASFAKEIADAAAWSRREGRPVHVGEFGAIVRADAVSRENYAAAMRAELERHGLGWAWWDWKASFAVARETPDGVRMDEALRRALLPDAPALPPAGPTRARFRHPVR